MKKFLVSVMMFLVFAIGLPLSAEATCARGSIVIAHTYRRYHRTTTYATRPRMLHDVRAFIAVIAI